MSKNLTTAKELKKLLKEASINYDALDLDSIKAADTHGMCDQCCTMANGGMEK